MKVMVQLLWAQKNQLHGDFVSMWCSGWSVVTGTGNVFTGGQELATVYISSQSNVTLNGNHILRGGQYAAMIGQYHYDIVRNDLANSYWGTSEPFSAVPLPAEKRSLDSFKSLFR